MRKMKGGQWAQALALLHKMRTSHLGVRPSWAQALALLSAALLHKSQSQSRCVMSVRQAISAWEKKGGQCKHHLGVCRGRGRFASRPQSCAGGSSHDEMGERFPEEVESNATTAYRASTPAVLRVRSGAPLSLFDPAAWVACLTEFLRA